MMTGKDSGEIVYQTAANTGGPMAATIRRVRRRYRIRSL